MANGTVVAAEKEAARARGALAANMKRWRDKAGVSQTQLAAATGISVSYISMIERGQRFPQIEKLVVLALALNRERWVDVFRSQAAA